MYYLAKFCRICIKTDVDLIDVDSNDVDSIKLRQKLEECTKMAITSESLSTKICYQCVKKLRITYDFHNMCKKSSNLLQGLLSELMNDSDKTTSEKFTNSELRVTLSSLKLSDHYLQKQINKTDRCSILKSLLSYKNISSPDSKLLDDIRKGGLKDIIAFTKNFDFGYVENYESATPLSKLVQFSEGFFRRDFSAFRETVLFIIENNNYLNEEEQMFDTCPEELTEMPFEEVVIEPDIRVKTELLEEDEDENLNCNAEESIHDIFMKEELSNGNIYQEGIDHLKYFEYNTLFSNNDYMKKLDSQRTFPHNSVRCRTRGNPYINPHLKKQFMLRSFQCKKCPRYFKTPGYLKAHCAKIHNTLNK